MPPNDLQLSVTRHLDATESELWNQGRTISQQRGRPLVGRADLEVAACRTRNLTVEKHPLPENPNHAHILGWPAERAAQKMIAQFLASQSRFAASPGNCLPGP
jgi:hypothetical protein